MCKIPVSVLIVTKNEENNIGRCLEVLNDFAQIVVIDSHSLDKTCDIASKYGVKVVLYQWNGEYPKKRGWCLDNVEIVHDWVFWVDADEVVTSELVQEIRCLFSNELREAGFFIGGRYVWNGVELRHGLQNNKIALFNRHKMEFPIIDDLNIEGMGEIEGHYQPALKDNYMGEVVGQLSYPLLHYAYEDKEKWENRHIFYAKWEAKMLKYNKFPKDSRFLRRIFKKDIKKSIICPYLVFIYSYIIKLGFLDGVYGYKFAISRKEYSHLIVKFLREL